jgi:hypothetical protein
LLAYFNEFDDFLTVWDQTYSKHHK